MSKLKVGDTVKIKECQLPGCAIPFIGKIAKITHVLSTSNAYLLDIDRGEFVWHEGELEKMSSKMMEFLNKFHT